MEKQEFKNCNLTWMPHLGLVFHGYISTKTDLTEAIFGFFMT